MPTSDQKIYTFWSLISETGIVIPKVQRDYAYGREEKKPTKVRLQLLKALRDACMPGNNPLTLDFVYGSIVKGEGMVPLDGQQRLTTLFLLYLYASRKAGVVPSELLKFRYATRTSANSFCRKVVDGSIAWSTDSTPSTQIKNSPEFYPNYDQDPTICAMLVTLDEIHRLFGDIDVWATLISDDCPIKFYYLPLDKFGLTDDLYIKMNSRGKPLTEYELFKSRFQGHLKALMDKEADPDTKDRWRQAIDYFKSQIDTSWTDLLWRYANQDIRRVDDGFMSIFQIVFRLRYALTHDNVDVTLYRSYADSISTVDDLQFLIRFMDTFELTGRGGKFPEFWDKYFYADTQVVSADANRHKVRLFRQSQHHILLTAINAKGNLTNADLVLIYAVYLALSSGISDTDTKMRFRVLRNLLVNSEFELRGEKVPTMLSETERLMVSGIIPTDGFNEPQRKEEALKCQRQDYWQLMGFENHSILRGSLALFIKRDGALSLLEKFENIFDNDYRRNTSLIRSELLKYGDYSQYRPGMNKNGKTMRYLINNPDRWRAFWVYNSDLLNQDAIVDCLEKAPQSLADFNKVTSLPFDDWRYYMITYDNGMDDNDDSNPCYKDTEYCKGVYNWEHPFRSPLVVNLLNSRTHANGRSNDNLIEWNLLTRILAWSVWDTTRMTLPRYGSSALKILHAGVAIQAVQLGWRIIQEDGYHGMADRLAKDGYSIADNVFIVGDNDYIVEGQRLYNQILSYGPQRPVDRDAVKALYPGLEDIVDFLIDNDYQFSHDGDVERHGPDGEWLAEAMLIIDDPSKIAILEYGDTDDSAPFFQTLGYQTLTPEDFRLIHLTKHINTQPSDSVN